MMHSYAASRCVHRWGQKEGIAALQDVLKQVSELSLMWADAQMEFIGDMHDKTDTCSPPAKYNQ